MIDKYCNISAYPFFEIIANEEILKLALENLERKKGEYYTLIKGYIINYEKNDSKMKPKLKKLMFYIQAQVYKYGDKVIIKKIKQLIQKLGVKTNKNIYFDLYIACIKYSEDEIIQELKIN